MRGLIGGGKKLKIRFKLTVERSTYQDAGRRQSFVGMTAADRLIERRQK